MVLARGALAFVMLGAHAHALDISRSGAALHLSGNIKPGDDVRFREALAQGPVRIVSLDSGGGFIDAAREIAREIRKSAQPRLSMGRRRAAPAPAP